MPCLLLRPSRGRSYSDTSISVKLVRGPVGRAYPRPSTTATSPRTRRFSGPSVDNSGRDGLVQDLSRQYRIPARGSGGEQADHEPRGPGDERRRGDREDPRPDDAPGHPPAHGREALDGADPHDRARDGVRGADRNAGEGGADQRDRAGGLGAEAAEGAELGDAHAHGLDDPPAPGHRAEAERRVRREHDPERHIKLGAEVARREEEHRDDAHRLLGIIAVLLFTTGHLGPEFYVPFWVVLAAHAALGLGTMAGGWRVVKTMGMAIPKLVPF